MCKIEGPYSPVPKIAWFSNFHPPKGETVEITGTESGYNIVNTTEFIDTTRTTQSVLTIKEFTAGEYWCQIYAEDIALEPSQRLCITEPPDYNRYPKCSSSALSQELSKCWDIPTTCVTDVPIVMATPSHSSDSRNSVLAINSSGAHATQVVQGSSPLIAATALPTIDGTTSHGSPGQTDESERLVDTPKEFQVWLYVVASLAGIFALLILVLTVICIGLCVLHPRTYKKPIHSSGKILRVLAALRSNLKHTRSTLVIIRL